MRGVILQRHCEPRHRDAHQGHQQIRTAAHATAPAAPLVGVWAAAANHGQALQNPKTKKETTFHADSIPARCQFRTCPPRSCTSWPLRETPAGWSARYEAVSSAKAFLWTQWMRSAARPSLQSLLSDRSSFCAKRPLPSSFPMRHGAEHAAASNSTNSNRQARTRCLEVALWLTSLAAWCDGAHAGLGWRPRGGGACAGWGEGPARRTQRCKPTPLPALCVPSMPPAAAAAVASDLCMRSDCRWLQRYLVWWIQRHG